ncbi:MAG: type II toxin-antitoxin system HicB family antitoxin [Moraxella equi]|nr:type II toxin-antitoxin system HicB family antitoxin [Moraxella equi]
MNTMTINNHKALITFDSELGLFRGEFIGLNGGADFYADSVDGLNEQGALSLQAFLDVCQEQGISPYQSYSGKFVTRLPKELHQKIAETATAKGISLNQWVNETLSREVGFA